MGLLEKIADWAAGVDDPDDVDEDELDELVDEFGIDWSPLGSGDDYFGIMDELGVDDGEDAFNLFDAVFGDDAEALQEWIDSAG